MTSRHSPGRRAIRRTDPPSSRALNPDTSRSYRDKSGLHAPYFIRRLDRSFADLFADSEEHRAGERPGRSPKG